MKKIITSASLAALGVAGVHAASAPGLTATQATKPWSVSASLRGFYDDNYVTRPKPDDRDSFGFEVSPSAGLNLVLEQTYIGLGYVYGMRYYEDRPNNRADHSHQFNGKLSHAFTERLKLDLSDSFVIAQEPELIDPQNLTTKIRTEGDVIRNTATATLTTDFTDQLGLLTAYSNTLYDFEQEGFSSRSALLDRMEHLGTLNLRYRVLPKTLAIFGYQFGYTEYTSEDLISLVPRVPASGRDNYAHYAYVGVDQNITPTLNASLRAGARYTKWHELNDFVAGVDDDQISPYVDASGSWYYTTGSYVQLGARHDIIATDVAFTLGGGSPILSQQATTVYGSINHRITGKLMASAIGQFQNAEFENTGSTGLEENYWLAGLNLSYEINRFVSAEAGYNYDKLDSDLYKVGFGRSFTRNRVYVGIRANF